MTSKITGLAVGLYLLFKPPERLKVTEWAEKNRVLSSDSSAEPGKWQNSRTPYMVPIMEAFTDPKVWKIYVKASAQVGKSELINNCFGYIVDVDPGPILWVQPTIDAAQDYSKQRLAGMIRDTPCLAKKVAPDKSRHTGNTILKKSFPGGFLAMVGTNAPAGLRSRPVRYVLGDERDAWSTSAGEEGNPEKLAEKRTATFFNRKILIVSTPTIEGRSGIEEGYQSGTQEEWRLPCPNCGEYHFIEFKNIHFEYDKKKIGRKTHFTITDIFWRCPDCGFQFSEQEMKGQTGKMVATNLDALKKGIRSFRLNAFISPWATWESIIIEFLEAGTDPLKLQVVWNTLFGETFEDRGEVPETDTLMERRENYGAELPEGVLVLTCGVDTQDDRLEYEVVGHGRYGEIWGIRYGVLPGDPAYPEVWEQLDEVIDKTYHFVNGKGLKLSATFIDSGGHKTAEVYENCRIRFHKKVFAIKGMNGDGYPHVGKPKKLEYVDPNPNNKQKMQKCWYYPIGVNEGKSEIMRSIQVQEKGAKYYHFAGDDQGYTSSYFEGLLSERLVMKRVNGKTKWRWEVIPGHQRNEPLDLRNYAIAAFKALVVDLDEIEHKIQSASIVAKEQVKQLAPRSRKRKQKYFDDW